MLILVSKTIFVSVYTPLVAVLFNASAQLLSSNLTMAVVERRRMGECQVSSGQISVLFYRRYCGSRIISFDDWSCRYD
jgi:hypothetical protein